MSISDAREFLARDEYMEFYSKVVYCGYRFAADKQAEIMDAYASAQNRELQERVEKLEKENETLHAVAADVNSMTHGQ